MCSHEKFQFDLQGKQGQAFQCQYSFLSASNGHCALIERVVLSVVL